jgi:hypothetical protein
VKVPESSPREEDLEVSAGVKRVHNNDVGDLVVTKKLKT